MEQFLVCPHCNVEPLVIATTVSKFPNGMMAGIFYCENCRKVLGIQSATIKHAVQDEEKPRIVVPS